MPNSADIKGLRAKYAQIPTERFFAEIFDGGEYKSVFGLQTPVVLDIGALAGEFAAYIYDQAEAIYAFEPLPSAFAELKENIETFGLTKVVPLQLALTGHTGAAHLTAQAVRGGHALSHKDDPDSIEVACTTLSDFFDTYKIDHVDLLKIDIEGGETKVFLSEDFPEVAHKIDRIIGEHFGEDIILVLTDNGFSKEHFGVNTLFSRKEPFHHGRS